MSESKAEKGLIFDIQNFSLHDGPGIRTLIFLKGCFLRCKWCANPEGQVFKVDMLFDSRKCTRCGQCIIACKSNASRLDTGSNEIMFDRNACKLCGDCIKVCLSGARNISGLWYSISEIIDLVLLDETFYRNSGGGVTLGGGEPTFQFVYTFNLLKELKHYNINTAIETCGFINWEKFKKILPFCDLVIFDFKHLDNKKHKQFTGVSNVRIKRNLKNLLDSKKNIIVRITLIPGFNDSEKEKKLMVDFIRAIRKDVKIEFLKYHEFGKFKYNLLGKNYEFT